MTAVAEALFTQPPPAAWARAGITGHAATVAGSVFDVIRAAADRNPRNNQVELGMSEMGEPCARRLAYRMLGHPQTNVTQDPWPSLVGTAVHAWLAENFGAVEEFMPDGRPRYVIEQRVTAGGIFGSADLLDRKLATLIDWKLPGPTGMTRYRGGHISPTYRVQSHGYGVGYRAAGETVNHVAIVFLPRGGNLADLHVWSEPLNEQLVDDALGRVSAVLGMLGELDVEAHPKRYSLIPTEPSPLCGWCPWHLPRSSNPAIGCPGAA